MSELFLQRLQKLQDSEQLKLLSCIQHGIEKECLRVDNLGHLSQQPHPTQLGSPLTHPYITTDYSEALLEFITPVHYCIEDALQFLFELHQIAYQHLHNEQLWPSSMPCLLEGDDKIPIAQYGNSNIGTMKSVYRKGLWHRYGKPMQTIAGIHYNFSFDPNLWGLIYTDKNAQLSPKDLQSEGYFALIRNFNCYAWLLMYLFGASPATSRSFFDDIPHELSSLHKDTLYLPYATSLRMSDLGYTNQAQACLNICFNSVDNYINSLESAINTPYPKYQHIGLKLDGKYQQLSTNILQIENEYYSAVRPKRITTSGQWPIDALRQHGVEYVEVRCLDLNPMLPMGIDNQTGYFFDLFLIWCTLQDSPSIELTECQAISNNFTLSVNRGREPGLKLYRRGQTICLQQWGASILAELQALADLLDNYHHSNRYNNALKVQQDKIQNPELTPSAQILDQLEKQEFLDLMLQLSMDHHRIFNKQPLAPERTKYFDELKLKSQQAQKQIEKNDNKNFDQFLQDYFSH